MEKGDKIANLRLLFDLLNLCYDQYVRNKDANSFN